MNKYINYYYLLGINNTATQKEIKKAYYAASKLHHPDVGGDLELYKDIIEAYKILSNEATKSEYDKKSTFGSCYDELYGYDFDFANKASCYDKDKYNDFIQREQLNIIVYIDNTFDGSVEYERWVYCKNCKGTGKDPKSGQLIIKSKETNSTNYIDLSSDECEFCNGSGKWGENNCYFCAGAGKIEPKVCDKCNGTKRYKGKQKLTGIVMDLEAKDYKIEFMGHYSQDLIGKSGHLWIVRK